MVGKLHPAAGYGIAGKAFFQCVVDLFKSAVCFLFVYGVGILRQQIRAVRHFKIFGVFSSLGNQFHRSLGGIGARFRVFCGD